MDQFIGMSLLNGLFLFLVLYFIMREQKDGSMSKATAQRLVILLVVVAVVAEYQAWYSWSKREEQTNLRQRVEALTDRVEYLEQKQRSRDFVALK